LFALVLAVSLMLVPAAVSAQPKKGVPWVLWGVTGAWDSPSGYAGRSEVFKVNTATGVVTMVSNSTLNPLYGDIAMTRNGKLYASGADDNIQAPNGWGAINFNDFYRLDPATGAVIQKWSNAFTDAGFHRVNALCAESNKSLLAIEGGGVNTGWGYPTGPRLLRITLDAHGNFASITNVGTLMDKCSDGDLDRDPKSGKWYGGFWESAGSAMWEIDVTNPGASTCISQSAIKWQGGFAFRFDGTAYAGSWAGKKLYTVDVLNGGSSLAYDLSGDLAGNIYGLSSRVKAPRGRP